jgi:hypothetical protein
MRDMECLLNTPLLPTRVQHRRVHQRLLHLKSRDYPGHQS